MPDKNTHNDATAVLEMHVLMCDDARPEAQGTVNLIGVYSGEVGAIDPDEPIVINLWISYRLAPSWRGVITLRLLDAGETIAEDSADFQDLEYDVGTLNLPKLYIPSRPARELKLQYKTNHPSDSNWRTIKRIGISLPVAE